MNILDTRLYRNGVLEKICTRNIDIHVRSVFLQGLFYLDEFELRSRFPDVVPHINKLQHIAEEANMTIAELSLIWLINLEQIDKVIIGVDNVEQLKAHLKIISKNVDCSIIREALKVKYENESILNPSLWQ